MSGNIGGPPEPFSLSPLLALLPDVGEIGRLEALVSSLYARQEKVEGLRAEASEKEVERTYAAESAMLRQILEWLTHKGEVVE
jgi:hypothetical protein